jgi:hypothetical protein
VARIFEKGQRWEIKLEDLSTDGTIVFQAKEKRQTNMVHPV